MKQPSMWQRALSAFGLLAVLSAFLFAFSVRPAAAAGIEVNSAADTVADDGVCTLREAITAANTDTASGATAGECAAGSGADAITFAADYTITLVGSQLPAVTTEMTITGNGAANTIIQANAAANTATYRVFEVGDPGNLTLDGVTVRHGVCAGACAAPASSGGGIYNTGTATVTNSTISSNSAQDNGGGIYNTFGPLTVTNSTLSGNSVASEGGGIFSFGIATVTNSTLSGNSADLGGGIFNSTGGTLTVTNSTLSGNSANVSGGIHNNFGGWLTVTRSLVSGNSAGAGDEVLNNNGTITVDANNVFGHSGQTNAGALSGFTPGASDVTATSDGTDATALTDILETTLADNGGPTETHALVAGSPAIDLGPTAACDAAPVNGLDQRGEPRNVDGNGVASANECDAGAYEYSGPPAFCTGFPMSAGTETQLNEAISCYNLLIAAGSYTIDLTADIDLTASTVAIDNPIAGIDLLLDGQGFAVDGQDINGVRPFEIETDSDATFDDITIMGGNISDDGGGIFNDGTLTVTNSTLSGNSAGSWGGGIYNGGTLHVIDSTLSGNSARVGGGIVHADGTLTVTNTTLSGNTASIGGGMANVGSTTMTVTNSTLSGNSAEFGGGIYNGEVGTLAVTNSTLSGNSADFGGGILNFGTLTVTNSTLSGNSAVYGGGIYNSGTLTVTNSTLSGNSADEYGGGIFNRFGGMLTVTNSTLSGNSADEYGGGIYNDFGTLTVTNSTFSGNSADYGGGINNLGALTVTNSTLSGNFATVAGGIYNNDGTLTMTNSTLSGNSADYGGGILNAGGTLSVTNGTLSGNAAQNGGGIYNDGGTLTLTRSVISGNSATSNGDEIIEAGTITANAFNVFGHSGQSNADAFDGFVPDASDFNATSDGTDPTALTDILDTTLANNGGPTQTHALVAGSPAIDFGPTADCAAAPVNGLDQRGEPRSIDIPGTGNDGGTDLCDAGAYEMQFSPPASFCPVDPNVGQLRTDLLGVGQGSPTKGIRTRKLVIPYYQDVASLYGQLASVESGGVMKYVRFRYPDNSKVQIYDPTSLGYRAFAVSWWGSDLDTGYKYVKGQFFWGTKGNKMPRAFVLWPTYNTTEEYANVFTTFGKSIENHVAWETGFNPSVTQTIAIPEVQANGAEVTVQIAVVDVNKDTRTVTLTVEAGGVSEARVLTVPNSRDLLNLEEFVLENVPAGTDEVTITLESPDQTGDSAAMIGAAVNYECELDVP